MTDIPARIWASEDGDGARIWMCCNPCEGIAKGGAYWDAREYARVSLIEAHTHEGRTAVATD